MTDDLTCIACGTLAAHQVFDRYRCKTVPVCRGHYREVIDEPREVKA